MAKKWFHFALPMFVEAETSWVEKNVSSANSFKIPEELLDGVAELVKKYMVSKGKLLIFTETKFMVSKTSPHDLVTVIDKKEYNLDSE
ncbi:MAG: hypothetical protein A2161_05070 [Candidatus Schekmanbacteria bacterium RBG_13_48_7]|uniref:Uncharacterized protein n=1 Tax=Candidatus Schekmanbacteria bacterium RBG_13_48_7 TaxID=1817878 RepID=A0A1F7RWC4_9BACT|nr:MAG: hypothetical protein A2161_05070 [Candidatus Schekmanbacteria bacterium RBG_13_48_7]